MGYSIYELLESATRVATTDAANVFGVDKSGHQVVLSDRGGEEKVTISDKSGIRVRTSVGEEGRNEET